VGILAEFYSFAAVKICIEDKAQFICLFEQDHPGRWQALRIRGCKGHGATVFDIRAIRFIIPQAEQGQWIVVNRYAHGLVYTFRGEAAAASASKKTTASTSCDTVAILHQWQLNG
jgi:hypothetical protein